MSLLRASGAIFGFGILVLVLGLFVAPLVGASGSTAERTVALQDGDSDSIHQNLNVSASIDSSNNATFTVVDQETFNENTTSALSPGENETLRLSGADIAVNYDRYSDGGSYAVVTVEFPPTFQYSDGAQLFYEELGLLLSIVGGLIAISGLVMGVRAA